MTAPKEGWNWLSNATKWHYFVEGRSLCRRWMCFGTDLKEDTGESPDDCAACRKALTKRKGKA